MSRMPDDPFRGDPRFEGIAKAALLWDVLGEMTAEEFGRAVRALSVEDLRGLVLERLLTQRFRVDREGGISWDRPELDEDPEEEPER